MMGEEGREGTNEDNDSSGDRIRKWVQKLFFTASNRGIQVTKLFLFFFFGGGDMAQVTHRIAYVCYRITCKKCHTKFYKVVVVVAAAVAAVAVALDAPFLSKFYPVDESPHVCGNRICRVGERSGGCFYRLTFCKRRDVPE